MLNEKMAHILDLTTKLPFDELKQIAAQRKINVLVTREELIDAIRLSIMIEYPQTLPACLDAPFYVEHPELIELAKKHVDTYRF